MRVACCCQWHGSSTKCGEASLAFKEAPARAQTATPLPPAYPEGAVGCRPRVRTALGCGLHGKTLVSARNRGSGCLAPFCCAARPLPGTAARPICPALTLCSALLPAPSCPPVLAAAGLDASPPGSLPSGRRRQPHGSTPTTWRTRSVSHSAAPTRCGCASQPRTPLSRVKQCAARALLTMACPPGHLAQWRCFLSGRPGGIPLDGGGCREVGEGPFTSAFITWQVAHTRA